MKLYLVRHGQTDAKEKEIRQGPDSPLSALGISQIESTANFLKSYPVDLIISSPWARASQSAEIISQKIKQKIVFSNLIHEKEQHPELYYHPLNDSLNLKYENEFRDNWLNFDWKLEGKGESISEVITRAQKFKDFLLSVYLGQKIIVVSHEHFLRCLVSLFMAGSNPSAPEFQKVYQTLVFSNAGLTILNYDEVENSSKLEVLNFTGEID